MRDLSTAMKNRFCEDGDLPPVDGFGSDPVVVESEVAPTAEPFRAFLDRIHPNPYKSGRGGVRMAAVEANRVLDSEPAKEPTPLTPSERRFMRKDMTPHELNHRTLTWGDAHGVDAEVDYSDNLECPGTA